MTAIATLVGRCLGIAVGAQKAQVRVYIVLVITILMVENQRYRLIVPSFIPARLAAVASSADQKLLPSPIQRAIFQPHPLMPSCRLARGGLTVFHPNPG